MPVRNKKEVVMSLQTIDFYHIRIPLWLLRRKELKAIPKQVYAAIKLTGQSTGKYYAGQEYLAELLGCEKDTIKRAVAKLKKFKLIGVDRSNKNLNNNYTFFDHPWMQEEIDRMENLRQKNGGNEFIDNTLYESEGAKTPVRNSEGAKTPLPRVQKRPSHIINKSKTNKSNNICDFSPTTKKAKLNEQIKEVFNYWQKEVNQPSWSLTKLRVSSIRSALTIGIKRVDKKTLEEYEEPLTIEQLKELITLTINDPHMRDGGWIDLQNILTQKRMTAYVEGRLKPQKKDDLKNNNVLTQLRRNMG